ncbi:hypothetical protein HK100_011733 [Physocladia obscura]|uniref:Laccase n=1 Tax=Physocladia obscura TaxID=109957 RepID=A0AAD5T6S5_9FUNG|nr:hypothetical protein HK100_011733 [Physocladia obscura]
MHFITALVVIVAIALHVCAETRVFTLNVAYTTVSPDGFAQPMMLANGEIDYPIVVNAGDTVEITVNNHLNVSTSLHWHGLFQNGTPWMDGASMATQCPIKPGGTFLYKFNVGKQTGTYWWHAHHQSQYINGLRGPFIINDPKDPYLSQYDYDVTMTLTDFFHNGSAYLLSKVFYIPNNTNAFEPLPDSGLIGGVGQYNCSVSQAHNKNCVNNNPLKKYTVKPGKRYRFRIINTAAQARYLFSIDGHNLTVIESDGVYTNPTVVNQISIHTAQRYSFILTANETCSNYWIRAEMVDTWGLASYPNGLNFDVRAILSYAGTPNEDPTTSAATVTTALNPYTLGELNGLTTDDLPDNYNDTLYFQFQYGPPTYEYPIATIDIEGDIESVNNGTYIVPSVPTLKTFLQDPNFNFSATINPYYVNNEEWALTSVNPIDSMEHPFHLHGHSFYVLEAGKLLHAPLTTATLARRDTIQVPACTGGKGSTGETGCTQGFVDM